jgi:hypothetical protein
MSSGVSIPIVSQFVIPAFILYPGSATFDLTGLPHGLLIIRGDSGWVKKIVR